jgi:hypothetical protein
MGVMPCHILNCENIMCDTYIDQVGHVCTDCQTRFKHWMKTQTDTRYLDSKNYLINKLMEFQKISIPIINYEDKTELEERIDQLFSNCTRN